MIIYKTTNLINGKIYIGQDTNNNEKYLGSGKLLKMAIKKYGKSSFIKEIIDSTNNKEELNLKEIFWIKHLKSNDRSIGYNITEGGEGIVGYKHSEEAKNKMSINTSGEKNPMYNKTFYQSWIESGLTDEEIKHKKELWLKKRSELSSGENNGMFGTHRFGSDNPFYGKNHSDDIKKRLRENSKTKKTVLQFDMDGILIREWESTMDVYRELKINCRPCCRGIYKSAGGFKWEYKNK